MVVSNPVRRPARGVNRCVVGGIACVLTAAMVFAWYGLYIDDGHAMDAPRGDAAGAPSAGGGAAPHRRRYTFAPMPPTPAPADDGHSAAPMTRRTPVPAATEAPLPPPQAAVELEPAVPDMGEGSEPDESLREWNRPYHRTRRALRSEQEALGAKPLREHTFFTTDCTFHSLWQAMTLEHSWAHVNNVHGGGFLTRITSGCSRHRQPDLKRHILPTVRENAARRAAAAAENKVSCDVTADEGCFGVFFAPYFSTMPNGESYAPYNRPNGIWYWLNHTDLTEDVFILLDPDMIYLSRLHGSHYVRPGRPAAQYYVYMDFDRLGKYECELCAKPGSFDRRKYSVGPPWMIHISDLRKIMSTWVGLVPVLKQIDPTWIVEMVAYAVACAYHDLPHKLLYRGMVDNIAQDKGWDGFYLAGHAPKEGSPERLLFERGVIDDSDMDDGGRKLPPSGASILDDHSDTAAGDGGGKENGKDSSSNDDVDADGSRSGRWWHTKSEAVVKARRAAAAAAERSANAGVVADGDSGDATAAWWKAVPPVPRDQEELDAPVSLLHYCYTWEVGEKPPQGNNEVLEQHTRISRRGQMEPVIDYFHWSKYRTPTDWPGGKAKFAHNFVSCDAPLLQEFHTPWALPKNGGRRRGRSLDAHWMRTSHFLHLGLPVVNEAMTAFKHRYCPKERNGGFTNANVNFQEALRTSHPTYWIADFLITDFRRPAGDDTHPELSKSGRPLPNGFTPYKGRK